MPFNISIDTAFTFNDLYKHEKYFTKQKIARKLITEE